jgi:SAM-dependent methyltransferase
MLDHARGDYETGDCVYRDGDHVRDATVGAFYFTPPSDWSEQERADLRRLDGPVLDLGCGAGRHALALQESGVDVLAVDASPNAVQAASERGVVHAVQMDMFDLTLPADAYGGVVCIGTQATAAGSLDRLAAFCRDLDRVATDDARVLLDSYDPTACDCADLLGYRADPREGLARRSFRFVCDGVFGDPIEMLLFSPDRLRAALVDTDLAVTDVARDDDGPYYRAVLASA